jgi:hypothetical protein
LAKSLLSNSGSSPTGFEPNPMDMTSPFPFRV